MMMIPSVLTQLIMVEEILLTPMATLMLRTMKIEIELEALDWKENLWSTSIVTAWAHSQTTYTLGSVSSYLSCWVSVRNRWLDVPASTFWVLLLWVREWSHFRSTCMSILLICVSDVFQPLMGSSVSTYSSFPFGATELWVDCYLSFVPSSHPEYPVYLDLYLISMCPLYCPRACSISSMLILLYSLSRISC